ncbi:MAG: UDP-N-acetylmuramoyl-L-alanine--D-glutamate ligase [Deltaproteobacteria bacterium]|nr:UDP-N-acetylmuramoyl-L-alanine--D-glutamate ligase [Deltaproteobacteria bacterium]MBW1963274.1 UDP-N-acetylmuramoyl-L-alanine--D-glutamate ligase [Deltaproteobacteria bacterium]MBW1992895.1 UDP-N-acetylmuramoyl-L-alanine--D-glutamate ligase [Deltaproteobacteria bacterium]MBW2151883.1 UDP-N-acetylmuramoyl-L-alanine--D-glutamate ligase [Deltaproteobacteria bacterium]
MDLEKKNILIVGLGVTGLAMARFLTTKGAFVTVTDTATERELASAIPSVKAMGVRMELGGHRKETFTSADMIILSPGVPHRLEPLRLAKEKGVPVWGEIEMAFRFIEEPIIAVTGTNGKTTTTVLLAEMLKASGMTVFVGGNIGTPLIKYVRKGKRAQMVVAEVSSFQLDTIETFRPKIGVLLNITEDHLDRYENFDAYANSKARLFENQQSEDLAILNGSDATVMNISRSICSKKWLFNAPSETCTGATIEENRIVLHIGSGRRQYIDLSQVRLKSSHYAENAAAAGLAALAAGGNLRGISSAIKQFRGLPHRIEYVTTKHGVRFFNDSKATNIDAVQKALISFKQPVILIMGGRNKGGNFETLRAAVRSRVKKLVLMGEAASDIHKVLGRAAPAEIVSTMLQAVYCAKEAASPGDVVLLSPGCTSFDLYRNYEHRGDHFRSITQGLP